MLILEIIFTILFISISKAQICSQNCYECTSPQKCTTCLPYFYLNLSNHQCYSICPINCIKCSLSGICNMCDLSYSLDKINNYCNLCDNLRQCNPCPPTYYFDENYSRCSSCGYACSICYDPKNCVSCMARYFLNVSTQRCHICNYSCLTCSNNTYCHLCQYSYFRDQENGTCIKCSSGCNVCKNQSYCLYCTVNLINNYGQCVSSIPLVNESKTGLIIGVIIAGVISLVACMIFGCIYYFMKKRRLQQINGEQNGQRLEDQRISTRNRFINDSFKQQPTNDFKFEMEVQCSICLQMRCDLITQCSHYFHKECLKQWLARNEICPLCKNTDIEVVRVLLCEKCLSFSQRFCILNLQFSNIVAKQKKNQLILHKCKFIQIANERTNKNENIVMSYKQQQKQEKQGQTNLDSQNRLRLAC